MSTVTESTSATGSVQDPHAECTNDSYSAVAPESAIQAEAGADLSDSLADVGAASFGGSKEAVFLPDDRVRVTTTDQLPWRVNASLLITAADGSQWIGTAWFISPRTLVTAGHCVFINHSGTPGRDGWVRSIAVMPGRDEAILPFGSITATSFRSVMGWTQQADERYDYGVIVLPNALPASVGMRRYGVRPDEGLLGVEATVAGYPGDKPPGTMWRHALPIHSAEPLKIRYTLDTAGGQSGAAVYVTDGGEPLAVGVHAYGGASSNSATRITQAVFDNLQRWSV